MYYNDIDKEFEEKIQKNRMLMKEYIEGSKGNLMKLKERAIQRNVNTYGNIMRKLKEEEEERFQRESEELMEGKMEDIAKRVLNKRKVEENDSNDNDFDDNISKGENKILNVSKGKKIVKRVPLKDKDKGDINIVKDEIRNYQKQIAQLKQIAERLQRENNNLHKEIKIEEEKTREYIKIAEQIITSFEGASKF